MGSDNMNYSEMVEEALRGVVREAFKRVERRGLLGNHHFYISFRTTHPGVEIAPHLHAEHPHEMTIVMQHQYWGLEVDDAGFAVTLSFSGAHERLRVPFSAITSFADPGVQFGLQFTVPGGTVSALPAAPERRGKVGPPAEKAGSEPAPATGMEERKEERGEERKEERPPGDRDAEVVALDTFRKKK